MSKQINKEYILVIDYEETGTTATLITKKGDSLAQGHHEIKLLSPHPDWVEFNPLESIYSVRSAINHLFQQTKITPTQIISIGITTSSTAALVWDKESGLPLYNGISSQDKRTTDHCESLMHSQLAHYIKEKTGCSLDYSSPAFYWKWLVKNSPETKSALNRGSAQIGTLDTWLLYNLTGRKEHITDYTHAFKTSMLDLKSLSWDPFLIKEFLLTESALPIVTQSSHIFGKTDGFLSLPDGIPILGVAISSAAELLGSNGLRFQESKLTFNQHGQFTMNTGTQLHNGIDRISPVVLSFPKEVRYGLEGHILFPDGITSMFKQSPQFFSDESALETLLYSAPDSKGIFMVPKRDQNNAPTTTIFGLKNNSTQSQIIRAYYESLVFNIRYFLDEFQNQVGLFPKELKTNGLLAKHDFLMQFLSNILQIPVIKMKEKDSKFIGMSYLVGIISGFYNNESELLKVAKVEKRFFPSMDPITTLSFYNQWLEHARAQ